MNPLIQLEKEHLARLHRQRDMISKEIKASERFIKGEETPDPVVPWFPKSGDWSVNVNGCPMQHPSYYVDHSSGRSFGTEEAAEQASKFFTFYQRYYSLAMEINKKYKVKGKEKLYSVACDQGPWTTASIGSFGFIDQVFTSSEAAQEAADIMNRDGWELPTL